MHTKLLIAQNIINDRDTIDPRCIHIDLNAALRNYNPQQQGAAELVFEQRILQPLRNVAGHNQHELLATLRRQIEFSLASCINEFVAVGSTQTRELGYTARIHMMSP